MLPTGPIIESMTELMSSIEITWADLVLRLVLSGLVVGVIALLRLLTLRVFRNQLDAMGLTARHRWRRTSSYVAGILTLFLVAPLWFEGIQSLATFLGLVAAGLVVSVAPLIQNVAGWFYIISYRPFTMGDRIEVKGVHGDVIDQRLLQFTLLEIGNWVDADQSTGRVIHVNNRVVFESHISNYTREFSYIWHEIALTLTFESNWKKAHSLFQQVADRECSDSVRNARLEAEHAAEEYLIIYHTVTPIVYVRGVEHGVQFTIRYLTQPRSRRSTEQTLWLAILEAVSSEPDIEFAYPTQRFYQRSLDGAVALHQPEKNG